MMSIAKISERDRQYYRETWGFDPILDRKVLPNGYRYECIFPLNQDASLNSVGLAIGARVEVMGDGSPHNFIFFVKDNIERSIQCLHTIIYKGPIDRVLSLNQEDYMTPVFSHTESPAFLPPWEHFAALKSFVAAIAELGIGSILSQSTVNNSVDEIPAAYGFNDEMQKQVLMAIYSLAPIPTISLICDWIIRLIEDSPLEWIRIRRDELIHALENESGDERTLLLEIVSYILNNSSFEWLEEHSNKLQVLFKDLYISPKERKISKERCGFDPWINRAVPQKKDEWFEGVSSHPLFTTETCYYYYIQKPLRYDQDAVSAQINLCGRVDIYSDKGLGFVFIGFERFGEKRVVRCDSVQNDHFLENIVNSIEVSIGNPLVIPPWSYAAALSIYLQQAGEQGITFLFPSLQEAIEGSKKNKNLHPPNRYQEQAELLDILYFFSNDLALRVKEKLNITN